MPAKSVRITTFCKVTGGNGTMVLPMNKVKAYRQKAAEAGIIITSSKPISS